MTTEILSAEQLEGISGGDFIPPANPINPGIPCPRPIPYIKPIPRPQPIIFPAPEPIPNPFA